MWKKILTLTMAAVIGLAAAGIVRAANDGALTNDPIAVSPKVWVLPDDIDVTPDGNALREITVHVAYPLSDIDRESVLVSVYRLDDESTTEVDESVLYEITPLAVFADSTGDLVVKFSPESIDLYQYSGESLNVKVTFDTIEPVVEPLPVYETEVKVVLPPTSVVEKLLSKIFGS